MPATGRGANEFLEREVISDLGSAGGPGGLFSVTGIKFTTARSVAERTLRMISARGGRALADPAPIERPPPAFVPDAAGIVRLAAVDPAAAGDLMRRIVAEESVRYLDDLVLRRTDWGSDPREQETIGAIARALTGLAARNDPGRAGARQRVPA